MREYKSIGFVLFEIVSYGEFRSSKVDLLWTNVQQPNKKQNFIFLLS